jgi:hypothetical protein
MDDDKLQTVSSWAATFQLQRDSARKTAQYFGGAAVLLFIALIWSCTRPAPVAAPCPASGVMQLDPTTVRARASESVDI